jgi:hypothetical protein
MPRKSRISAKSKVSNTPQMPSAPAVAFQLFQQREQMDRLSCYQERDGNWHFPKWADTAELKAQTMAICLKNATKEEKASLFKQNIDV